MNQKRTRIPLPHPPPYRESRVSFWLHRLVGLLLTIAIGASVYLIVQSLLSGSISTMSRGGPSKTYTLALQPRLYWFQIAWQSFTTLLLMAILMIAWWISRKGRAPKDKSKGKRAAP